MKIFEFSGFGNFTWDWDSGLDARLGDETNLQMALLNQKNMVEYSSFYSAVLPEVMEEGVFEIFRNEHNGSRNSWGYVIAPNIQKANMLLREYESKFEIKEYQP